MPGRPAALRLVGADIMCSVLYGAQTVLLLLVSRQVGLGAPGYGYMFAALGAGGLIGTALAGRVSRRLGSRSVLAAALAVAGAPTLLLAVGGAVLAYALLVLHQPRRAARAVPAPRSGVADAVVAR